MAIENLLASAKRECPDIAFGMTLQAFAGLHSADMTELKAPEHPNGGSILFEGNRVIVSLGLKKITIPSDFTEAVKAGYEAHLSFLLSECVDNRYPLFINSNGTVLSVEGYIRRVKQFGDHIITSDNATLAEVREYLIGTDRRFTGNMLRHWYAANILETAKQKFKKKGGGELINK